MALSTNSPRKIQLRNVIKNLRKVEASCKKQLEYGLTMEDVVRFLERSYPQKSCDFLKKSVISLKQIS